LICLLVCANVWFLRIDCRTRQRRGHHNAFIGSSPAAVSSAAAAASRLDVDSAASFWSQISVAEAEADAGNEGVLEAAAELRKLAPEVPVIPVENLARNEDPVFFYGFLLALLATVAGSLWALSKGYFENRELNEQINRLKQQMFTDEENITPFDKLKLGNLYVQLRDYPAAIAELEEVEEQWSDTRPLFDPEDTMGALASRATVHNSKGLALSLLEPPRPGQARREFVRAVTFWPENPEALFNIGVELLKRGRNSTAEKTLETALKWKGGYAPYEEAYKTAQERAKEEKVKDNLDALVN